mmetsp:Transcript_39364/g.72904  ORF Transcript_39364/g.72904 Transcript_39364/m.72904 type:complete len:291 (+) Transcript_39364:522-1394(+)
MGCSCPSSWLAVLFVATCPEIATTSSSARFLNAASSSLQRFSTEAAAPARTCNSDSPIGASESALRRSCPGSIVIESSCGAAEDEASSSSTAAGCSVCSGCNMKGSSGTGACEFNGEGVFSASAGVGRGRSFGSHDNWLCLFGLSCSGSNVRASLSSRLNFSGSNVNCSSSSSSRAACCGCWSGVEASEDRAVKVPDIWGARNVESMRLVSMSSSSALSVRSSFLGREACKSASGAQSGSSWRSTAVVCSCLAAGELRRQEGEGSSSASPRSVDAVRSKLTESSKLGLID